MNADLRFKICDLREPSRAKERSVPLIPSFSPSGGEGVRRTVERVALQTGAFTLIEMLVTVALLTIIVLGLAAMFGQTRRAFTSSLAQVDVLEAGRATADMIARDMEQMVPAYISPTNVNAPNFYVITGQSYAQTSGYLVEQLANPADTWTNIIQELLFLVPATPNNDQWNAIGYRLQMTDEQNSIGSLYRFYLPGLNVTNVNGLTNFTSFVNTFTTIPASAQGYFNRIIDGVTYFRVLAYEPNGVLITNANSYEIHAVNGVYPRYDYQYAFYSNALPAYVEVELGVMETQAYQKYRSFGAGTAAANTYLTSHPGVIHIFRQRIPIRDVDPTTSFP